MAGRKDQVEQESFNKNQNLSFAALRGERFSFLLPRLLNARCTAKGKQRRAQTLPQNINPQMVSTASGRTRAAVFCLPPTFVPCLYLPECLSCLVSGTAHSSKALSDIHPPIFLRFVGRSAQAGFLALSPPLLQRFALLRVGTKRPLEC